VKVLCGIQDVTESVRAISFTALQFHVGLGVSPYVGMGYYSRALRQRRGNDYPRKNRVVGESGASFEWKNAPFLVNFLRLPPA
jgi:hypothetical protein